MRDEGAGEAGGILGEQRGEVVHVVEGAAVGKCAARVHGGAERVVHLPRDAFFFRRRVAVAGGTIARAKAADGVEALEREAGGIDLRVARGTAGVVAMFIELLADGGGSARVRVNRAHARRRRRHGVVEQAVHHPNAALHGRRRGAVGSEFQDRPLTEQAAARAPRGQRHPSHVHAVHVRDAVVLREALREHREARPHERGDGRVAGDEFAQERARLGDHALVQQQAILGIELRIGRGLGHAAEVEPLVGEIADEALAARVGEQAIHFAMQHRCAGQRAIVRGGAQRVIGRAIPQPVGKARRQREELRICERCRLAGHIGSMEQKLRRREHRDVGAPHRVLKAVLRREPLQHEHDVGGDLAGTHRTTKRLRQESREQPTRILGGLRRLHGLQRRRALVGREVGIEVGQVAPDAAHGVAPRWDDICARGQPCDRQVGEQPPMTFRRPRRIQRPLDLKPIQRHAGTDMFRRAPRDLPDAQPEPRHRHRIEHDAFVCFEPRGDFLLARVHRWRRERAQQAPSFLLLPLRVRPQYGSLRRGARLGFALVPLESPQREPQAIVSRVEGRHIHRRLVAREVGIQQSDRAPALRFLDFIYLVTPLLEIRPPEIDKSPLVLKAAAHRERRVRQLVLQQHILSMNEVRPEFEQSRGIDASLEHRRRRAARGDRRGERLLGRLGIRREVRRREVETARDFVEARDGAVGRKQGLDVQPRQGQQIDQSVFVFAARHPPQPHAAFLREPRRISGRQHTVEFAEQRLRLRSRRARLFLGRHFAGGNAVVDLFPAG